MCMVACVMSSKLPCTRHPGTMHAPGMEPPCILTGCVRGQVTTRGGSPATLLTRYAYKCCCACACASAYAFLRRDRVTPVEEGQRPCAKAQAPPSFLVRADTETEAVQCAMQRVWRHLHSPAALLWDL